MSDTPLARALHEYLMDDDGIRGELEGRTHIGHVPQGAGYPFLQINDFNTNHEYHLGGEAAVAHTNIQLDIWAKDPGGFDKVRDIGELIRSRLSGKRVALNDDVFVNSITITRDNTTSERPVDGSDDWRRRRSFDFRIFHKTST